ncbi:MAG: InlB B-repeat-containing protein, partial [Clostridia bacterium]|nr:InlB B-repeat-containing protein [Clostridia bacterium]
MKKLIAVLLTAMLVLGVALISGASEQNLVSQANAVYANDTPFMVTYDANGGVGAPEAQISLTGESLTLSSTSPTRFQCTFRGWSTSKTATSASYQPGGSLSGSGKITLYAVWGDTPSTLTSSQSVYVSNSTSYRMYVPSRSGNYTIYSTGSSDTVVSLYDASGTRLAYDDDSGSSYNFSLSYYLTAGNCYYYGIRYFSTSGSGSISTYFTCDSYTYSVRYDANGGTGAPDGQSFQSGASVSISETVPTRWRCTFLGWSTSSTATTATYQPGDTYSASSDITLYAVWGDTPMKLTSGSSRSVSVSSGSSTYCMFVPSTNGNYTIYSSGSSYYTYVVLYDADGTQLASNRGSYNFSLSYNLKAGTTYYYAISYYYSGYSGTINTYLQYNNAAYLISYDANGGTDAPASQWKQSGSSATLSTQFPSRPPYRFVGWALSPTATTAQLQRGDTYPINADITLYAVWELPTQNLTLPSRFSATVEAGEEVYYRYVPSSTGDHTIYSSGS